jgi:hypothetical protein
MFEVSPTATHDIGLRHDTEYKSLKKVPSSGVELCDQIVPFQESTSPPFELRVL